MRELVERGYQEVDLCLEGLFLLWMQCQEVEDSRQVESRGLAACHDGQFGVISQVSIRCSFTEIVAQDVRKQVGPCSSQLYPQLALQLLLLQLGVKYDQ